MIPDPLFILNSTTVVSKQSLSAIDPKDISNIEVVKIDSGPSHLRQLSSHGIVNITLKKNVRVRLDTKTPAAISKWLNLNGPVSYLLNEMPLGTSDIQIATNAIEEIKVARGNSATPNAQVDIRLAESIRVEHPPGTILIRGTAVR